MCWWSTVAGSPAEFSSTLRQARVVGVLRAGSAETAYQAAQAAVDAGLKMIEFTFTTPQVTRVIERFRAGQPGVPVGAGTVMNAGQASEAINAGAQFLVSPHLGEDIQEVALQRGIPYIPGVLTPTEIMRALALGVPVIKLFPAGSAGGAAYLKDLLGPFPDLKIMVTGGIKPVEVGHYLQAGALAVGLGSQLFPRQSLQDGDWNAVKAAAAHALLESQ